MVRKLILILTTILTLLKTHAGDVPGTKYHHLQGKVADAVTGKALDGANIFLPLSNLGAITDSTGQFGLRVPEGLNRITISYLGYTKIDTLIEACDTVSLHLVLKPSGEILPEVQVVASRKTGQWTGAIHLDHKFTGQVPVMFGEKDILKALQTYAAVNPVIEGNAGYTVRGGSIDQNLVLLDGATLYNPSHFLGFFSIFNYDAIESATLYKGELPAEYGGRLSSVLDITMADGHGKKISTTGEIGLISSKLTIQGPVKQDRLTFMVSARRTYADLFIPLLHNPDLNTSRVYFYDLYGKMVYRTGPKSFLSISVYKGDDVYKNHYAYSDFGNEMASLNWEQNWSARVRNTVNAYYSNYTYRLGTEDKNMPQSFVWNSSICETGIRDHLEISWDETNKSSAGFEVIHHCLDPVSINAPGTNNMVGSLEFLKKESWETSAYLGHSIRIFRRLYADLGLRVSSLNNTGQARWLVINQETNTSDTLVHDGPGIYYSDLGLEPRIKFNMELKKKVDLFVAYTRTRQYMNRVHHSLAGNPLDIWISANPAVAPQLGDQFSAGIQSPSGFIDITWSIEGYYKLTHDAMDFKDHSPLLFNEYIESDLCRGSANAYGLEVSIRKDTGPVSGMMNYTFSRSTYLFAEINSGQAYASPYDVPHNFLILVNWNILPRLGFSAQWDYATGRPFSIPGGKAIVNGTAVPVYSNRNDHRLPDNHRLDISLSFRSKPWRKFQSEWNLSVYNVYNRKNIYAVTFVQDTDEPGNYRVEKQSLFPVMPSVSYRFSF